MVERVELNPVEHLAIKRASESAAEIFKAKGWVWVSGSSKMYTPGASHISETLEDMAERVLVGGGLISGGRFIVMAFEDWKEPEGRFEDNYWGDWMRFRICLGV